MCLNGVSQFSEKVVFYFLLLEGGQPSFIYFHDSFSCMKTGCCLHSGACCCSKWQCARAQWTVAVHAVRTLMIICSCWCRCSTAGHVCICPAPAGQRFRALYYTRLSHNRAQPVDSFVSAGRGRESTYQAAPGPICAVWRYTP